MPVFSIPQFEIGKQRAYERLQMRIEKTQKYVRSQIEEKDKSWNLKRHDEEILSSDGGRCLPIDALNLADIIVTTTGHIISKSIRYGTNSSVSHAALYIGNGEIIDAMRHGVQKRPIFRMQSGNLQYGTLEKEATLIVVLRHKSITSELAQKVVKFARGTLEAKYDNSGLIGAGLSKFVGEFAPVTGSGEDFYCSELIAWAYKEAGIPLAGVASSNTPGQLIETADTKYVGHLKMALL